MFGKLLFYPDFFFQRDNSKLREKKSYSEFLEVEPDLWRAPYCVKYWFSCNRSNKNLDNKWNKRTGIKRKYLFNQFLLTIFYTCLLNCGRFSLIGEKKCPQSRIGGRETKVSAKENRRGREKYPHDRSKRKSI
jgi:hypothetical protein